MGVNILERVPVGRVAAEAERIRPGRALLTLLVGLLYLVGWASAKTCQVLVRGALAGVVAARWAVAAVRVGWVEAGGASGGRSRGVAA